MKKYLIAAAALAATTAIGFSAQAGELNSKAMTDQQLDQVVAGQMIYAYATNDDYAVQTTDFTSIAVKGKKTGWQNIDSGTRFVIPVASVDTDACIADSTACNGFSYTDDGYGNLHWTYAP